MSASPAKRVTMITPTANKNVNTVPIAASNCILPLAEKNWIKKVVSTPIMIAPKKSGSEAREPLMR